MVQTDIARKVQQDFCGRGIYRNKKWVSSNPIFAGR